MRLLCIQDSYSDCPDAICVKKDCIYNPTRTIVSTPIGNSNIWYELLETSTYYHHSSLFRELEDEPDKILEEVLVNEL